MSDLLTALKAAKPREKAGAHTTTRYGFQINVSILKILDLHQAGLDYRAAFDHFDDLMVFDKSMHPDRVSFYQIKSKANGVVTMKEVARARGAGPKPRSYLGKMNQHMGPFAEVVDCLGFISNPTSIVWWLRFRESRGRLRVLLSAPKVWCKNVHRCPQVLCSCA